MAKAELGAENDDRAMSAAIWALREIGAKRQAGSWGVGGSQEVSREEWNAGCEVLVLEGETYIGLTLSGPDALVARVATLVRERLA